MIKVTFKEPQLCWDWDLMRESKALFWFCSKLTDCRKKDGINLVSMCGKYQFPVSVVNIKSIEHVKPTDI